MEGGAEEQADEEDWAECSKVWEHGAEMSANQQRETEGQTHGPSQ